MVSSILIEKVESSELSRSIKAKLQNSFKFEKVFENDEEIAKKVNNFMLSYFNNIGKESATVSFWLSHLKMVKNVFLHYRSM